MKLRDHPLTCHQNAPSWPPVWVCVTTGGTSVLTGEVGTLIRASMHDLHECRISLRMQNGEHEYVGHLLIDDSDFCLDRLPRSTAAHPGADHSYRRFRFRCRNKSHVRVIAACRLPSPGHHSNKPRPGSPRVRKRESRPIARRKP